MRVLVLTNGWPTSSRPDLGVFTATQVASIERQGIEAVVEFIDGSRGLRAYISAALRILLMNVRSDGFDLVHAHTGHCGLLAMLQRRVPVVISFVGYDLNGVFTSDGRITLRSRFERQVFRQLPRFVEATITKSARMEQQLPTRFRVRNTVVPNGVDRALFRPIDRSEARQALSWPVRKTIALFAADPALPGKRFAFATEVIRFARRAMPDLELRVVSGRPQSEVCLAMNAADVLLFPSRAEGSPNVVKEALACNLPIVASDVGDVADLLRSVDRCEVLRVDADAQDYARAIVRSLDAGFARTNGRTKTRHLSAEAAADRIVEIYAHAARGTRQARVVST